MKLGDLREVLNAMGSSFDEKEVNVEYRLGNQKFEVAAVGGNDNGVTIVVASKEEIAAAKERVAKAKK